MPKSEQLSSTPEPSWPKEKGTEPSVERIRLEEGQKVKVSKSPTLARERGIRKGAWRGKGRL